MTAAPVGKPTRHRQRFEVGRNGVIHDVWAVARHGLADARYTPSFAAPVYAHALHPTRVYLPVGPHAPWSEAAESYDEVEFDCDHGDQWPSLCQTNWGTFEGSADVKLPLRATDVCPGEATSFPAVRARVGWQVLTLGENEIVHAKAIGEALEAQSPIGQTDMRLLRALVGEGSEGIHVGARLVESVPGAEKREKGKLAILAYVDPKEVEGFLLAVRKVALDHLKHTALQLESGNGLEFEELSARFTHAAWWLQRAGTRAIDRALACEAILLVGGKGEITLDATDDPAERELAKSLLASWWVGRGTWWFSSWGCP